MPIGVVGATLISAAVGVGASVYAAKKQSNAAKDALEQQQTQYNQSRRAVTTGIAQARTDLAPYMATGKAALGDVASLYGLTGTGVPTSSTPPPSPGEPDYSKFFSSPDYEFALEQGILALDRSAAARGQLTGGGHLRDLTSFGQGLASQQYGNYFNRLMSLVQGGQSAATAAANAAVGAGTNLANLSMNFGNSAANSTQNQGAAAASGAVGVANALSNLPTNLLYAQYLNNNGGPSSYVPAVAASGAGRGSPNLTYIA